MKYFARVAAASAAAVLMAAAGSAGAAVKVNWVDWTYVSVAQHVIGSISTPGGPVGVDYSGNRLYAQVTGGGTDNWVDDGYTQGAVNRPTGTDIIMLGNGGTNTVKFDHSVTNPFFAFADWSRISVDFGHPFALISEGCGVNGCGNILPNATGDGFLGVGDVYGVVRIFGTFDTLTFTDKEGAPHGFTVGLEAPGVPEPTAWGLMILGFAGAGATLRARRGMAARTA